ncbi:DNA gyrase subunit A [Granulicatella balaenopterae]|uniref:DNA gyrase subunit A n=1 Tax=Granulicatella balaenopterae TaxID=137733 RepID=A0A1H9NBX8_9LACT|nr:DNA gyrase subunit A [Granulicatella balaenopterae]SER33454.1 DNA gyrase subunit A [Granulicatella balaenopterae]
MSEETNLPVESFEKIELAKEMRKSFLEYSMSVIVSRALPDVRDGLKPVHRRILYGMHELGVTPDKPHKKSARIVGDVMGKYHPHGDSAIYESMVRMAQDFSYRYPLVDGHGNFGSVDGDGAAAMRYTEARMSKIALEMLRDINKKTIDYRDNYDGSEREPEVLPARIPNLLVNGATGIAVGMATNIPPHNLGEVISALHILMKNPDATTMELMEALPGPDFPTGGIVLGKSGIRKAYETGRGSITIRGRVAIEELKNGKERIIITELPYMVNKAKLVERIAELHREKKVDGITYLNDESDRTGMRVVIEVRRDVSATVVLNNLYKLTSLQTSFGFNMLAIADGVPRVLNLKEILSYYLEHQEDVIRRRAEFDKQKAEARAHILEGLQIALDHIDAIVAILRSSKSGDEAKAIFIEKYGLSDKQAQAILDMRMIRLTGLEREKIDAEHHELQIFIAELNEILASEEKRYQIIEDELLEIKHKFDNPRRTELLIGEALSLEDEDLIEEENIVVTLTNNGYIKRQPSTEFKTQKRGGRGVQGMGVHNDDFVETMISCSTHDSLLFFTNTGKVYRAKGYEIPEYGRTAKGLPVINLLNIDSNESIQAIIAVDGLNENHYLFFTTLHGTVKRVDMKDFKNIRTNGLRAIHLREDDQLIRVVVTSGDNSVVIGTHQGYAASFHESKVRSMGRTASGVRGINLREGDYVIGMDLLGDDREVLVVSENGYGKRTKSEEYALKNRGGKGVKTINITDKNGPLVCLRTVTGDEDIMVMTDKGVIIRFSVAGVSQTGRDTLGVRMMRLDSDSQVASIAIVEAEEVEQEQAELTEVTERVAIEETTNEEVTEDVVVQDKLQSFAQELVDEQTKE